MRKHRVEHPESLPMRTTIVVTIASFTALASPTLAEAALPSAATGGAKNITQTSALLTGTVNPNSEPTTYSFQYGPTKAYGSQTPQQGPTGATKGNIAVSAELDGLTPASTYHFRVVATNASGTKLGGDKTFKTLKPSPAITLGASAGRIAFGRSSVLAGQFTPAPGGNAAGVKVKLEQDPAPFSAQEFKAVATTTTDAAGHFTFTQAPRSNTSYRVVSATNPKATSATVVVAVALRVTLSLSSSHPPRGKTVVFSGTVGPQRNGQLVRVQKRVGRGWRTVRTAVLAAVPGSQVSSYRVRVRVRKPGVYRAYVAGEVANLAGVSRRRLIRPR
jgi:hypothetical protein